jgi:hypothetical protein
MDFVMLYDLGLCLGGMLIYRDVQRIITFYHQVNNP